MCKQMQDELAIDKLPIVSYYKFTNMDTRSFSHWYHKTN